MDQLDTTADQIRAEFEQVNTARDHAYQRSRELISLCARSIRAIHREEWEAAETLIAEAKKATQVMVDGVRDYPNLYHAGYTQDAVKEFVEANLTYALVRDLPLPTPEGETPNREQLFPARVDSQDRAHILSIQNGLGDIC